MRLFEETKRNPSINLTPLIDILFLLIIFFVVSSRFVGETGIALVLPKSGQASGVTTTVPVVMLDRKMQLEIDGQRIEREDWARVLGERATNSSEGAVVLNIDRQVPHGEVVGLMDLTKKAGFRKVVFGTRPGGNN